MIGLVYADFMGQDKGIETFEYRVIVEAVVEMPVVGVGKQQQPVILQPFNNTGGIGFQGENCIPHRLEFRQRQMHVECEAGFPVKAILLEDRENVVRKSDIIFTVTTGSQALGEHSWLKPGAFVARLGSYQEVDHDVITKADKVIVDRWKYVSPRIPEIIDLVENEQFTFDDVYAEWPNIVAGEVPGREFSEEIIVFIALGIWGEYAAILPEAYRRALARGLGKRLSALASVP